MPFTIKLRNNDGTMGSIVKQADSLAQALELYDKYIPVLGWEKAGYSWGF